MAQYEMNLRDYWLIIRRRKFIIIVSTLLVMGLSYGFAMRKTPFYEATASVKFEQSASFSGLLVEVLSYSSADSIETQASLIRSYPILEDVARRLGRLPEAAAGEPLRESKAYTSALDAIAAKIRTMRVPNTSIIEISATSTNPREARDLANTVAQAYRDYNRSVRNAHITEARKFIEAQLREVEGRVKRAEEEVWAFREANRIIAPGAETSVLLSVFTQLRGDIEKTRQHRTELELAQTRLGKPDANGLSERVFVESANPALQKLQSTQVELMLERNNLALEVTDRHPRLQALDDRMREVRSEMRREIGAQISLLRSREDILNRQMGELLQRNRELPAVELGLQRLQRDAKVNDDLLTLLKTKHQEALIKESEGVEEVTIIRPATEPSAPVGGEAFNTILVGAILGLMLGLVLAFVQETLDTSIGTIEDVESYLQVPVLGIVPHIDAREMMERLIERRPTLAQMDPEALRSHALLITHFDPKSPVAEAYRTLRTNIQFMRVEREGKLLVVTSPTLQEGKTTTIVNLAITMAQNGQRTLLVGANMRRPSIHRFFGIEREPGLSDILVGRARWRDCIRTVADILMGRFEMEDIMASPGLDNLHIIEAGPVPGNPSELLSAPAMGQFLREIREEYDIVLIDTPPVLPVTDSAIAAAQVDGVVLVYQAGKVGRLVLKRAKAHLDSARAKVWGVVLNDVQAEVADYSYTHYYTHYYGEESPGEAGPGRVGRMWDAVSSRLGGRGAAGAPAAASTTTAAPASDEPMIAEPRRRRSKARYLIGGIVVVLGLLATAYGFMAWRFGSIEERPRDSLRRRLEQAPTPPTAPPRPTAPQRMNPLEQREREPAVPDTSSTTSAAGLDPAPALVTPEPPPLPQAPPAVTPAPRAIAPTVPAPRALAPSQRPARGPSPAPAQVPQALSPGPAAIAPPPNVETPAPVAPAPAPQVLGPAPSGATPTPQSGAPATRFAVEFGPFTTAPEAERLERQLNQAGYQTVRFRQQTGAEVFAVLIDRLPSQREAELVAAALREQGFRDAVVLDGEPGPSVRIGEPLVLRGAVQLGERLRARGHQVRIATQRGDAVTFVIRHGNFISRQEAETKSQELEGLGLANNVVRVR
jgi:polysaccharide biosynthesis transport protein